MARIGNLGSLITFEVSSDKVLTFNNLQKTSRGRWAKHNVLGGKPASEFLGADLSSISFDIYLSAMHNINPRRTIERIEQAAEDGDPLRLVIGGRRIGSNLWVIESVSSTWGEVIEDGKLVAAHMNLSLTEYV